MSAESKSDASKARSEVGGASLAPSSSPAGVWESKDGIVAVYRPRCHDPNDPEFFRELEKAIRSYFPGAVIHDSRYCGDDEAIHFSVGNTLLHVCYTEPEEVTIELEVQCPVCGRWIPSSVLAAHLEEHEEVRE